MPEIDPQLADKILAANPPQLTADSQALSFLTPPFRSPGFVLGTITIAMALAILCVLIVSHWQRLSGDDVFRLVSVGIFMATVWCLAFISYRRIHKHLRSSASIAIYEGSLTAVALSCAAAMIQTVMLFTAVLSMFLILQLEKALGG